MKKQLLAALLLMLSVSASADTALKARLGLMSNNPDLYSEKPGDVIGNLDLYIHHELQPNVAINAGFRHLSDPNEEEFEHNAVFVELEITLFNF